MTIQKRIRHRWRAYQTAAGRKPVKDFLDALPGDQAASILAAMKDVSREGLAVARQVRGEIYEVRAFTETQSFRVLFALEGKKGRILLALEAFSKKTQKTPDRLIQLAERRLADWRARGRRPVGR